MNFLAHFYLSENNPDLITGNFLGDFVTSKQRSTLERGIAQGVLLHYAIDDFTDKHPIVVKGKEMLYPRFSKYAAVISDIYFDYFLAKNWRKYSYIPLEDFASYVYATLEKQEHLFDFKARLTFEHMRKNNWLARYAEFSGIERSLHGIAQRAAHANNIGEAAEFLQKNTDFWQKCFDEYFPELVAHAKQTLQKIKSNE